MPSQDTADCEANLKASTGGESLFPKEKSHCRHVPWIVPLILPGNMREVN